MLFPLLMVIIRIAEYDGLPVSDPKELSGNKWDNIVLKFRLDLVDLTEQKAAGVVALR